MNAYVSLGLLLLCVGVPIYLVIRQGCSSRPQEWHEDLPSLHSVVSSLSRNSASPGSDDSVPPSPARRPAAFK